MRFTTNAYPKEQRWDAWRFTLQRHSLDGLNHQGELYGELVAFRSALEIQFTRLTCTPQRLKVDFSEGPACFWLALLLDGDATAEGKSNVIDLAEGDMVYGGSENPAHLDIYRDSRLLLVSVPYTLPTLQMRATRPQCISNLVSERGIGRMFSGLLRAVADSIADISDDQLRPVEAALPEFISIALLDNAPAKSLGGAAGARAALLERICQTIEMRLSDPDLNLHEVAKEHGISPRYLQKLFESRGDSFSRFVRMCRLERCRLDLRSPLYAQRSISDILFQWGFNDSATFSRAFRERYGVSPREYRKRPTDAHESESVLQRGRPATARDQMADVLELAEAGAGEPARRSRVHRAAPSAGKVPFRSQVTHEAQHHVLRVSPETVHWGYFSSSLKPALSVRSGDSIEVETLTHHAYDDYERMIKGDEGAESVYAWTGDYKAVNRRGAGPIDASTAGRGPGEGFGVHICTGPIEVEDAEPGDVIEVRILQIDPRPCANPLYEGRSFGSNAATFWGFHYNDLLTEPKPREVVTIYEIEHGNGRTTAHAVYNYRWTPQTDPDGIVHERIDYPGVPVDPATIEKNFGVLSDVEVPVRPHFGVIGLAPANAALIDSVPPSNNGGNLDNWRLGPGASLFLPVATPGGLLSLGDPHASQGDSELCGTAIECSMTAVIQPVLHKAGEAKGHVRDLDYPLIETANDWVIFGFSYPEYLKELGPMAQSEVYAKSSLDLAMRDAFRKARRFLMTAKGLTEDEAISLLSVAVDFAVTQVVNGNLSIHAVIPKSLFVD